MNVMSVLIVGLGNPGQEYAHTRHNAGFLAVDALAEALQEKWKTNTAAKAEVIETRYFDTKLVLAKPQTFMNLSGDAVAKLAQAFHIAVNDIWIVSDDVALPLGTLRIRTGGSAGGHNGLKSIIERLGSEGFVRFRIGVNEPPARVPLENYVVEKFTKTELKTLEPVIHKTREMILKSLAEGIHDTSLS
jgi:peptidyl-tRNA hydrolase, PTH1 family